MRRSLLLVALLAVGGVTAACSAERPEPRADVYWAELRSHIKIWNVEAASDGAWKITYDLATDGPRYSAITIPMERPPFSPGQRAIIYGKMAQTGDILITSIEEDPLAASPSAAPSMTGTPQASASPAP